jgi:hypothetical protein
MIILLRLCYNDISFNQWRSHNSYCSKFMFYLIISTSLINYKFNNILWSKFSFFPILSSIDKLKPYTVISGISMLSVCGIVVSWILLSYK